MDHADFADEIIQREIDAGIESITSIEKDVFTGSCFNCDAILREGLYCDDDCQQDHTTRKEHEERMSI